MIAQETKHTRFSGFSWTETFAQRPLAIEIEYARSLSGLRMAERSLDEMQRIAPLSAEQRAAWFVGMKQAFPDVAVDVADLLKR